MNEIRNLIVRFDFDKEIKNEIHDISRAVKLLLRVHFTREIGLTLL